MKKLVHALLLISTIFSIQSIAHGIIFYNRKGYYLAGSVSVDWNTSNRSSLEVDTDIPVLVSGRVRPKDCFNANLSIGYYIDQWRLEAEGTYRNNRGNADFSNNGVVVTDFGYLSRFSTMFNVYYDIPLCTCWWGFYAGGGVGAAFSKIDVTGAVSASESDVRFAGQLMAGVFRNITPCIILTFGYRIFATTAPEDFTFSNATTTAFLSAEGSPITQSFELGLRITL